VPQLQVDPINLRWGRDDGQTALHGMLHALPATLEEAQDVAAKKGGGDKAAADAKSMIGVLLKAEALVEKDGMIHLAERGAAQLRYGANAVDCVAAPMLANVIGAREMVQTLAKRAPLLQIKLRGEVVKQLRAAETAGVTKSGTKYVCWPLLLGWMTDLGPGKGLRLHPARKKWLLGLILADRRETPSHPDFDPSLEAARKAVEDGELEAWTKAGLSVGPWGAVLDAVAKLASERPEADVDDIEYTADVIYNRTRAVTLRSAIFDWAITVAPTASERAELRDAKKHF